MSENTETAILAGGCFWPAQELLRHRDGVISTRVGYTGGENDNPTADNHPGHTEAVEVTFDPARTSYRAILEFFLQIHRPDLGEELVGSDYRSEIFYTSDEQRQVAVDTIADAGASGLWPGKVVTKVSEAGPSGKPRPKTRSTSGTTPRARISSVCSCPLRDNRWGRGDAARGHLAVEPGRRQMRRCQERQTERHKSCRRAQKDGGWAGGQSVRSHVDLFRPVARARQTSGIRWSAIRRRW